MMTTVVLGGALGKKFQRTWRFDLDRPSASEALRALFANCKPVLEYLRAHSKAGYHVFCGDQNIGEKELGNTTGARTITILPALEGGETTEQRKNRQGATLQIILGAILVAAGILVAVFVPGSLPFMQPVIGFGLSLMIGGISRLLFQPPPPGEPPESEANRPNNIFDGPVNTIAQGHPVPICYGELEVGSQVISAGIVTHWSNNAGFGGTAGGKQKGVDDAPPTGGTCPAIWTPILLADGSEVPAGDLRVGDKVWTMHEGTGELGAFEVAWVQHADGACWRLMFDDGTELVCSLDHRVKTMDGKWTRIQDVRVNDVVFQPANQLAAHKSVVHSGAFANTAVVKIEVADAHTYVSSGVLSHNVKSSSRTYPL